MSLIGNILTRVQRGLMPSQKDVARAIVMEIANGKDVPDERIAPLLVDWPEEQFFAAVKRAGERLAAVAELEELKALEPELQRLMAEKAEARNAHGLLFAEIQRRVDEANNRLAEASTRVSAFGGDISLRQGQAMNTLMRTADPELFERCQAISNEINGLETELGQRSRNLESTRSEAQQRIETLPGQIATLKKTGEPQALAQAAALLASLASARTALRHVEKIESDNHETRNRIAKLEGKRAAIEQQYLKPENVSLGKVSTREDVEN